MTKQRTLGNLFVVSGPSGVGKGTVIAEILKKTPKIEKSISVTTRKPRANEENGKDYFFVSEKEFQRLVEEKLLMEWAEYTGNFYGTPMRWVKAKLQQGIDVILEIEIQGAKQIHSQCPDACLIFLLPPSMSVLEERLKGRATESPEKLALRLSKAREEMAERDSLNFFLYEVVNDNLDDAVEVLERIVYAKRANDN